MTRTTIHHPSTLRRGFSLPEVMFAVMILGIGFIMVAAMFPVAIQQAKDTREEGTGTMVARSAVEAIRRQCAVTLANYTATAPAKIDMGYNRELFGSNQATYAIGQTPIRFSSIYQPDSRYAWTALYRRNVTDSVAQVFVFVLTSQDGSHFDSSDMVPIDTGVTPDIWPNLFPRRIEIRQNTSNPSVRDTINIRADTGAGKYPDATGGIVENCFLVTETGEVLRLASSIEIGGQVIWQLYPGQDATPYTTWTKAWFVGRRRSNPAGVGAYDGVAQDIAVYTTFVR
jgi:prepilin-type N-terminal cleavage/methylation domain-containing protein